MDAVRSSCDQGHFTGHWTRHGATSPYSCCPIALANQTVPGVTISLAIWTISEVLMTGLDGLAFQGIRLY
jgi:hypothetical protein